VLVAIIAVYEVYVSSDTLTSSAITTSATTSFTTMTNSDGIQLVGALARGADILR
jgi:hypothetical protein